jgi:hypothetical protein
MKTYKITVYDVKWNDTNYVNDWFEVYGDFENEESIDIESLLDEQDADCNEIEGRDDLRITNFEYTIELEK